MSLGRLTLPSLKPHVTAEEWQARVDLAACYRLVAHYGMSDMMANHITLRVPGEENAFLTNPYGMMYEEMSASCLVKIDHDGQVLYQPDFGELKYGLNKPGFILHSAIHKARPEVACVIHTHTPAGMAVSSLACGLLPMNQTSMRFLNISYHEYMGVVLDMAEQDVLVRDLGSSEAMVLRNHGLLTCGRTVRGLQLDAPPGAVVPRPTASHGLQHPPANRARRGAARNLPQLPTPNPPPLWRDGVAWPAAHARSDGPDLPGLNFA